MLLRDLVGVPAALTKSIDNRTDSARINILV